MGLVVQTMTNQYLQVVITRNLDGLLLATSANNESLAKPKESGCLALFVQWFVNDYNDFPQANDYFDYLSREGWHLLSSNTMNFTQTLYNFSGGRNFRIVWQGENWYGKPEFDSYDERDYYWLEEEPIEIYDKFDDESSWSQDEGDSLYW